jgi:hypothetical protein
MKINYFDNNASEQYDLLCQKDKWIELVTLFRLSLYNKEVPCGAKAILEVMDEENINPLPSISTIYRILREQCLTHSRTGYYEGDDTEEFVYHW